MKILTRYYPFPIGPQNPHIMNYND